MLGRLHRLQVATIVPMRILVVEARGLHIGYLGCYGNDWIATPNLDRLAAEGIVFDRHYLDGPELAASKLSLSLQPAKLCGIEQSADFGQAVLDQWRQSPADHVFIRGPNLAPPWHLPDELRDVYFDEDDDSEPWTDPPTDVVLSLTIPEQLELQNTYAAAVTWFDAQLGALLDDLRAAGELEHALVCVTSNAGLPLGEHGLIGPARAWLHEEVVHVPLLMRIPSRKFAGRRIEALTQAVDIGPTLAAFCGHESPPVRGHNLLPLLRDEVDAVRPYACSRLQIGGSSEWSLRTLQWALLAPIQVPEGDEPRSSQLYIKPADRWEVNDVRQQHLDLAEGMERTLRAFMAQEDAAGPSAYPPLPADGS